VKNSSLTAVDAQFKHNLDLMNFEPLNKFNHLLRLWRVQGYLDLMWMTQDWKLFLTYYASDLFLNIAAVTGVLFLAERFDGIGVWTKPQVTFMLGYAMLVRGIMETLFGYNIFSISRRLGRGQLDHTLVQPHPVWMALLTEGFMPFSGSASIIPGLLLLLWSGTVLALDPTISWLFLALLNVAASATILLSFSFIWGSLAFWAPRATEEISSSASGLLRTLMPFPLDGLSFAMLSGLMTFLPVGFLAWYPARALLGLESDAWSELLTPTVAAIFSIIAVWIFKQGLKAYGRTGSQRYLSFGHRR
jgi:ABC-2 type transport system permease protein